jgi:phytoene synthase
VPTDILDRHGGDLHDVLAGRSTPALRAALEELRAIALHGAREATEGLTGAVPAAARPAFLHLALVPLHLKPMARSDYDPFTTLLEAPQWRRQWRLWRVARALGDAP